MPEGEASIISQVAINPSPVKKEGNPQPFSESELKELANNAYQFVKGQSPVLTKEKIGDFEAEIESPYIPRALMDNRRRISPDVGRRFDAHGISKLGYGDQIKSLVRLLSKGVDNTKEFHTTALRLTDEEESGMASAIGATGPYELGAFIVISFPDSTIKEKGICAVLVEEHFYPAIPVLQEKFPNVIFIRADQIVEELQKLLSESEIESQK